MTHSGRTAAEELAATFHRRRSHLFGVAYRMVGTVAEAEDAVQETWLRVQSTTAERVTNPEPWLTVVITRVCLDVLKSARVQREQYTGEWLPEPIAGTIEGADPADRTTMDESISLALLVVLESLSPAERTSFVLHDVFKVPYETIAEAVGRTPQACRQLATRARAHVAQRAPRFDPDVEQHRQAVSEFARATSTGDFDALVAVLDPDVVLRSDGGGRVRASLRPVVSAPTVATFVRRVMQLRPGTELTSAILNNTPALVATEGGRLFAAVGFTVAAGRIIEIDLVMNPDKLAGVGSRYSTEER